MYRLLLFILPADIVLLLAAASLTDAMPRTFWARWPFVFLALTVAHLGFRVKRAGMGYSAAFLSHQALAMGIIRRAISDEIQWRITGATLRWAPIAAVVVSLLLAPHLSLMAIMLSVGLLAVGAWPYVALEYIIPSRHRRLRMISWTRGIIADPVSRWLVAAWAIVIGASALVWHAGRSEAHAIQTGLMILTIVELVIVAIAVLVGMARLPFAAIKLSRENRASSRALRAVISSRRALRTFVQALRMRPGICAAEALSILSDLAARADDEQIVNWASREGNARLWARKLLDQSAIDNVALLGACVVDDVRRIIKLFDQSAIDNVALLSEQVQSLGPT
jgi:hypothetical protein